MCIMTYSVMLCEVNQRIAKGASKGEKAFAVTGLSAIEQDHHQSKVYTFCYVEHTGVCEEI